MSVSGFQDFAVSTLRYVEVSTDFRHIENPTPHTGADAGEITGALAPVQILGR